MPDPAAQAKYTLQIPKVDNHGNELKDLGKAAHQYLHGLGHVQASRIIPGMRGFWQNDPEEAFDALETFAPDTPEVDGNMKQLAQYIAELGNQWGMFMTKEGGGNVNGWTINNHNYDPNAPAPGLAQRGMSTPQNTTPYGGGGSSTPTSDIGPTNVPGI